MVAWTVISHEAAADRLVRVLEAAVGPEGEVCCEQLQLAVCLVCGGAMPLCEKLLEWIHGKLQQQAAKDPYNIKAMHADQGPVESFYIADLAPCLERMTLWVEGTGHEIPGPMLPYEQGQLMSRMITKCVNDVEDHHNLTRPNQ